MKIISIDKYALYLFKQSIVTYANRFTEIFSCFNVSVAMLILMLY